MEKIQPKGGGSEVVALRPPDKVEGTDKFATEFVGMMLKSDNKERYRGANEELGDIMNRCFFVKFKEEISVGAILENARVKNKAIQDYIKSYPDSFLDKLIVKFGEFTELSRRMKTAVKSLVTVKEGGKTTILEADAAFERGLRGKNAINFLINALYSEKMGSANGFELYLEELKEGIKQKGLSEDQFPELFSDDTVESQPSAEDFKKFLEDLDKEISENSRDEFLKDFFSSFFQEIVESGMRSREIDVMGLVRT